MDGVEGDLDGAAGAVFEANGHGEAGGKFAVDLGLGGASADGAPGDEVCDVLGGDGVEKFGAGRDAHVGEIEEEFAGDAEAAVDIEGVIEIGIVDEAFPANGGAGFFKVDAHDDAEVVLQALGFLLEFFCVIEGGLRIVNGAGADDDEQAIVFLGEDGLGLGACPGDDGGGFFRDGEVVGKNRRGDERIDAGDA